ncbi:STAS domain-containing protein [Meloidogyne graminicola]|uniref:STAS domain-containing protein n=1 Tax=Meloidogyne graminicola TaxID=189291 RepID=A0A8S9ZC72_9BILA|nr:STAS domain-containing protein [Meloidogyne graminicola]
MNLRKIFLILNNLIEITTNQRRNKHKLIKIRQQFKPKSFFLKKFVPITEWLPNYKWKQSFFVDLCAGLTAAVFSIPTGIAHAGICGVAPVYGLYTVIFPTFFYMLFGHSRHNSLGAFAILSLITRAAIEKVDRILIDDRNGGQLPIYISTTTSSPLPTFEDNETIRIMNSTYMEGEEQLLIDESKLNTSSMIAELNISFNIENNLKNNPLLNDPIQLSIPKIIQNNTNLSEIERRLSEIKPINIATLILFLSGILQVFMGIFRLDFLSCYFSEQVMSGFVLGGCVHVFFSQLGDLLGIQHLLPSRSGRGYLYNRVFDIINYLEYTNIQTMIISLCSIFFLIFTQQIFEPWLADAFEFPIPYELLLVIIGITATNFGDLSNQHNITVVGNIPTNFPTPSIPHFELIPFVFIDAINIAVTSVAIHLTVIRIVENKYYYNINSCQELYSLGLSGICSSIFPVFPITSIFARTLIGDANINITQMTTFFSTLTLLTVILYIGPALEYLPKCILASIIIVSACTTLNKFNELKQLWPLFKIDFAIFIVMHLQLPKWHFLTHDEELNEYKEADKKQQFLQHQIAAGGHAFIIRYDAPLIFTSVHKFIKVVLIESVKKRKLQKKCSATEKLVLANHENTLIIDCSGFPYVDFLGLQTLKKVYKDFFEQNVVVKFAAPKAHLMRMFCESDFYSTVPKQNVFKTVKQAVTSCNFFGIIYFVNIIILTTKVIYIHKQANDDEMDDVEELIFDKTTFNNYCICLDYYSKKIAFSSKKDNIELKNTAGAIKVPIRAIKEQEPTEEALK